MRLTVILYRSWGFEAFLKVHVIIILLSSDLVKLICYGKYRSFYIVFCGFFLLIRMRWLSWPRRMPLQRAVWRQSSAFYPYTIYAAGKLYWNEHSIVWVVVNGSMTSDVISEGRIASVHRMGGGQWIDAIRCYFWGQDCISPLWWSIDPCHQILFLRAGLHQPIAVVTGSMPSDNISEHRIASVSPLCW